MSSLSSLSLSIQKACCNNIIQPEVLSLLPNMSPDCLLCIVRWSVTSSCVKSTSVMVTYFRSSELRAPCTSNSGPLFKELHPAAHHVFCCLLNKHHAWACRSRCALRSPLLLSEEGASRLTPGPGRGVDPRLRCRATIFSSWRATRPSQRATWRWCTSSWLRTSAGRACLPATAFTCWAQGSPGFRPACHAWAGDEQEWNMLSWVLLCQDLSSRAL